MKYNIIKTDDYLLIVSDEEIKEGDWFTDDNNSLKRGYKLSHVQFANPKKITKHLPLNNSPILEGVDLLPPLEDEVDELADELTSHLTFPEERRVGIVLGYNKAKEKYKYTEFDIITALEYGWNQRHFGKIDEDELRQIQKRFIQSLQQPKYPIGFECENENKIAIDGHTVIGSEPKTTTNSQSQTVLEGKYIYGE